ncbi:hypothetical protein NMYAN_160009 [Nitrosomonas nitrosa]|uniref:Uncharacterized protein n=1 Tax=Nitrosomonas nitrosa TaxID=52442 RepID=A0A8H8Z0R3_9PROT|nr:hypothetical protein NMYAN_160009 [Nitrosomonas nitrosa]
MDSGILAADIISEAVITMDTILAVVTCITLDWVWVIFIRDIMATAAPITDIPIMVTHIMVGRQHLRCRLPIFSEKK